MSWRIKIFLKNIVSNVEMITQSKSFLVLFLGNVYAKYMN